MWELVVCPVSIAPSYKWPVPDTFQLDFSQNTLTRLFSVDIQEFPNKTFTVQFKLDYRSGVD